MLAVMRFLVVARDGTIGYQSAESLLRLFSLGVLVL